MAGKGPELQFGDPAVFGRRHQPHHKDVNLSRGAFYVATNLSNIIGWVVLCAVAFALRGWTPEKRWHYFVALGFVVVLMIVGSVIAVKSRSWKVSAFAYLGLIAAPLGLLFGPFVLRVGVENMVYAMLATVAWTILLTLIGLAIPADLERAGFGTIILVLMGLYLVASVILIKVTTINPTAMIVMAAIGIVIFSLSLVYNVNRSKFVPKTLDHAVDIGMQNFLETVNIVLRVAQIMRYARS